jgi:hypothetical protein
MLTSPPSKQRFDFLLNELDAVKDPGLEGAYDSDANAFRLVDIDDISSIAYGCIDLFVGVYDPPQEAV